MDAGLVALTIIISVAVLVGLGWVLSIIADIVNDAWKH